MRALSTGESELYAIVKSAASCLHTQAILLGFGITVEAQVRSDATAGIGIASRHGSGRVKHLEVKWLWVQERVIDRQILLKKHGTETNVADLGTKYLAKPRMDMLLGLLAMTLVREADASALAVATTSTRGSGWLSACITLLFCAVVAVGFALQDRSDCGAQGGGCDYSSDCGAQGGGCDYNGDVGDGATRPIQVGQYP